MKNYFGEKKIYVKNEEGFVYKVESFETYDGYDWFQLNLVLVCGQDYVNPDVSDIQGWCPPERFAEHLHIEQEICYFMKESVIDCLKSNGWEILEKCPIQE